MPSLPQRSLEPRITTVPLRTHRPPAGQALLNQSMFRDALVRQYKQSDRFQEPFGLVLISVGAAGHAEASWVHVLDVLTTTARETDIVGWFEEGLVVGVIRSRVDMDHLETGTSLQATVERELGRGLTATAPNYVVRAEVYSPNAACSARPLIETMAGANGSTHDLVRRTAKRAVDIAGSATLLAVSSPLLLVIGALVKLTSDGPVFFRQERVGEQGKPFMMLKFRSMQANSAHDIHQQFVSDYIQGAQNGTAEPGAKAPVFKIVADPRVTKIGHFLRRSSFDELPQFWNVLKGDMSLVGPRPPLPYEVKVYKPWHKRRVLEAKPGITGLWQVTGRSRTTFDEMVRLDLRYAREQSVWVDLKILLATPRAVITGRGAH